LLPSSTSRFGRDPLNRRLQGRTGGMATRRFHRIKLSSAKRCSGASGPRGTLQNRPNEGHIKTGQWKQAGRVRYTRLWSAKARDIPLVGGVELHCEDLSGGYGNAGMRPERRVSGRKGRDGWRSKSPAVWSGKPFWRESDKSRGARAAPSHQRKPVSDFVPQFAGAVLVR